MLSSSGRAVLDDKCRARTMYRLARVTRAAADLAAPVSLAVMEKRALLAALERAKGNKAHAAAALGITRTQLYTRLRRFGLPL